MIDYYQYYTVKVANGSGCLFQPQDCEYSYVLTAKHVIEGVENISIVRQYTNDDKVINETLTFKVPPFLHNDKDAAIIKVDKVDNIELLLRADSNSYKKDGWYLCGHPKSRRSQDFSYRKNKLSIEGPVDFYIEAEIEKMVNSSEIEGQSGGGIIKSEQQYFLLAGIQIKMASNENDETLSRIHFAPLSLFDEIIEENKGQLSPLFPPYINGFSHLQQDIFPLPNLPSPMSKVIKKTLLDISKDVYKKITPNEIIKKWGEKLLASGTSKDIKYHKSLWISWLEFLTIIRLWDIDISNLADIYKKRKLLIVDTNCWTTKLEEIYQTDLSEVEKNGTIIICATNETSPHRLEIPSNELPLYNIAVPIDSMNIHNTVENPFEDLRLVNIFKFQNHIINNVMPLKDINAINSKEKLRELTNGII